MIVIIAGGRSYDFNDIDIALLDTLHRQYKFTKVLSGDCSRIIDIIDPVTGLKIRKRVGADYCGEQWAKANNIPVHKYRADWFGIGKAAGPIRNQQMVDEADALIAFPGRVDTADVLQRAKKKGVLTWMKFDKHYLDLATNEMIEIVGIGS